MKGLRLVVAVGSAAILAAGSLSMAAPVGAHSVHGSSVGVQVGLVTDKGGLNDKSFNHLADLGLLEAEHKYGVNPQCAPKYVATCGVLQSHTAADYAKYLRQFAQTFASEKAGHSVIIAVGFLMEQALYEVAKEYPKQHFAIIDGQPANGNTPTNLPNVGDLFFKPEQSGYLAGVVSGLLEKEKLDPNAKKSGTANNIIGTIAGADFAAVTAYNCGFQDGAKSVDPKITVYTNFDDGTFQNTTNANDIGKLEISKGADILFQVDGGAGLGFLAAAKQAGKWGIGVDADQDYLGSYVITSALKKVDQAVLLTVMQIVQHDFHPGANTFSLANGATGIVTNTTGSGANAPVHHIPASILKVVANDITKIKTGKLKLPGDDATGTCKFTHA
jgi:basic membrane protein A